MLDLEQLIRDEMRDVRRYQGGGRTGRLPASELVRWSFLFLGFVLKLSSSKIKLLRFLHSRPQAFPLPVSWLRPLHLILLRVIFILLDLKCYFAATRKAVIGRFHLLQTRFRPGSGSGSDPVQTWTWV